MNGFNLPPALEGKLSKDQRFRFKGSLDEVVLKFGEGFRHGVGVGVGVGGEKQFF